MKYIIFREEEITQEMLDQINSGMSTAPTAIYKTPPPEGEPGGVLSPYMYVTTEEKYPSAFKYFKKLNQEQFDAQVTKIQSNKIPDYKILNVPSQDLSGRSVVRFAATEKGWHYQAHSIEFEVNKLNSIYNKDYLGNDLGFGSIKVYRDNGDECTTQSEADTYGVKTIVKWAPSFDFEIISGNVRQAERNTANMHIYVNAKVATGLAAPYDWFVVPFTQGGINMKYIGADEILKTDGRASKLISATNGDHFEIVLHYEAGGLLGDASHEMSVIFEIYKDPTS